MSTADDPLCRNCRVSMQKGVVLEHVDNGKLTFPLWSPGDPPRKKFLGIPLGYGRNEGETIRVATWRCPRCGLLESYAAS